jgi:glycerol-3-phosphate cytidylyltransferase
MSPKTVLTLGTFDMLHVGHLELFRWCRLYAEGGKVVVAVNPDSFVQEYKGHQPIIPYQQRREMVEVCRNVDVAVKNAYGSDAAITIAVIDPDLIVVGDDWKGKDYLGQLGVTEDWLAARGIRVVYVPRTRHQSSTALRGFVQPRGVPAKNLVLSSRREEAV